MLHALRRNTPRGSRRNIAAHYDLGNDFFEAFLDPALSYSSAVVSNADMNLEDAQHADYERLCQKPALRPDDHLLGIGTGWGGLALHAASRFGCRVTTTTISRAQYERASERIARAGLSDRITLLFEDEPAIAAHRLLEEFATALGRSLPAFLHCDAHRWRYALPETPIGEACLWDAELRLGACGDWCLEGRVEAAFDSGRRLAQRVSTPDGGAPGEPIA